MPIIQLTTDIADACFVTRHLRKLLLVRNGLIKRVAESREAGRFLTAATSNSPDTFDLNDPYLSREGEP